jgi:hypothetical protein
VTTPDSLLPCPFCGSVPNIVSWKEAIDQSDSAPTAIECSSDLHDCPLSPGVALWTREEAIAAWNTRAALPSAALSAGEVEDLTAWRAMFSAWCSQPLRDLAPEAVEPLWPNNWPQDVAMVALALSNYLAAAPTGQAADTEGNDAAIATPTQGGE